MPGPEYYTDPEMLRRRDIGANAALEAQYRQKLADLRKSIANIGGQSIGAGGFYNQFQSFMLGFDRFHKTLLPANSEYSGYTFFTRPKLNLSIVELAQHRVFTPLRTDQPNSVAFALRCLLDTKFTQDNIALASQCPYFNVHNPFIFPLSNAMHTCSGWPDLSIEQQTTEGGFFNEDQTYPIGYDEFNRTYDIQCGFRDIQGGTIAMLLFFWEIAMAKLVRGDMYAYTEDIDYRRMPFTCSIYRFVLDPTRSKVVRYAKATGCFPRGLPMGGMFEVNKGETFVTSGQDFTVSFTANKIDYNDYGILTEFNEEIRRFAPWMIDKEDQMYGYLYPNQDKLYDVMPRNAYGNYRGLPYIKTDYQGIHLEFRELKSQSSMTEAQRNFINAVNIGEGSNFNLTQKQQRLAEEHAKLVTEAERLADKMSEVSKTSNANNPDRLSEQELENRERLKVIDTSIRALTKNNYQI